MTLLTNVLQLWRPGQYIKPHDAGPRLSHLFQGVQGAAFNVNVLSSLWLDTARTTPAVIEQPVACMDDLSGNGNHAIQATSTKRPVLSARVNLLTNTGFSGAVAGTPGTPPTGWGFLGNSGETVSVNADGSGGYAWRVKATNNRHFVSQYSAEITANSVWDLTVKLGFVSGVSTIANLFTTNGVPSGASVVYYINNTAVAGSAVPVSGDTLTNRITTAGAGGTVNVRVGLGCSSNSTGEAEFSKLSLTLAIDAHLPYQRVNTATDYDPAGFPYYLRSNGVEQTMATGNIDLTSYSEIMVSAGITALDMGATSSTLQVIAESLFGGANSFGLCTPRFAGDAAFITAGSTGTVMTAIAGGLGINPRGMVLTGHGNQAAPYARVRLDGAQVGNITTSQGVGGYGNRPISIGSQNGASRFLNGRLYSLIVRAGPTTPQELAFAEQWNAQNMRRPI